MIRGIKSDVKSRLNNIYLLQQLLQTNKDEMIEAMELQYEIRSVVDSGIAEIFDKWLNNIEDEINKIDKELTFILNCINQIRDAEDKKIIIELYVNRKSINEIEKEFGMEHDFMIETLEEIYIQLKRIIRKNQVNYDLWSNICYTRWKY